MSRKKIRRDLAVIGSELQAALTGSSITIGALLIEAREQLKHGEWMAWLDENFGSSVGTAENYMNAARFAAQFAGRIPTVANLKLRPTLVYLLGNEKRGPFDSTAIEAILQEAESTEVSVLRAWDIYYSLQPTPSTAEQIAMREAEIRARNEEIKAEIDSLLDGPPPELPPAPEATTDVILPPFDQAIHTLGVLKTKPLHKFAKTSFSAAYIRDVSAFLGDVAKTVDRQQKQKAL